MRLEAVCRGTITCLVVALAADCSSSGSNPSSPTTIGAPLVLTCTPTGADVRCTAVQGFDAAASDVTAAAAWSSAGDAGVAIVQSPGYFKTLGTGVLDIRATANGGQSFNPTLCSGLLSACGSFGYYVAPQAAPERMILLVTSASRLSGSSFSPIAGATVEVAQPQRTSVCVTNGTDPCTFWVFDATIRIKATASGYGTSDQTLFGPLTDGSYAIPGSPRVPYYLSWPVLMYPPPPGGAGD